MLDILRQKSRSTLIYFMFAAVIIIFAFGFGAGGSVCNPAGPGGTLETAELIEVDGEVIDTQLLGLARELSFDAPVPRSRSQDAAMREQYYRQTRYWNLGLDGPFSGGQYGRAPDLVSPIKDLKVLDELIETKVVASYAKKLGMGVSSEELNARLARLQRNFRDEKTGEFDRGGYHRWLANMQASAPTFEAFVRDELLRERVIALLVGEVTVADAELEAQHKLENDKVKIAYVSIDKSSARALVPVTDADVDTWLGANADKAQAEYDKRKANEFTTPKSFVLRMIKVDAPDPASTDDAEQKAALETERKAAREEIDKALSDIRAKIAASTEEAPVDPAAAFAEVATAVSDDASKDAGGKLADPVKLPELARIPFGAPVAAAAATFEAGKISEVIETPTAFFVFMPESVSDEVVTPFEVAKRTIGKIALQEERVDAFKKTLADEVLAEAKKQPTAALADVVAAVNARYGAEEGKGLQARDAEPFARLQSLAPGYPASTPYIFGVGKSAPLVRAAFGATLESPLLPEVYTATGDKLIVARLLEKTPAEAMTDDAKKELSERLTAERRRALYRGWYEDLLAKKTAAGEVERTSELETWKKQLEESWVQQGGTLPGMTPPAGAGAGPGPGSPTVVTLPVTP
ncbi:MAG: SurA N-terminal domain-containing protein [Deltaproteobacteria bacterium]|nr:SurA N-terminal domain-containing protein [Deltaproteobacteria bacterium]